MSYAFTYDVPINEQVYQRIKADIGDARPDGLVLHLVVRREGGLRYVDVWESREDWYRFRDARVEPAVDRALAAAGFDERPPHPVAEEMEIVDLWAGA